MLPHDGGISCRLQIAKCWPPTPRFFARRPREYDAENQGALRLLVRGVRVRMNLVPSLCPLWPIADISFCAANIHFRGVKQTRLTDVAFGGKVDIAIALRNLCVDPKRTLGSAFL